MNVYLISSHSIRLAQDEINNIVGQSNNIVRMNMDEITISDLINECSYYSLLPEKKYVIINNFKLNKENNSIVDYIKEPHPDTILILISDKIDKRSVIYKEISKSGKLIIIDDIKNINTLINNYCKSKNIIIDNLSINQLLNHNLNNYDLVLNEIDKISIVTNKITKEEVEKYSIRLINEDNFAFCDAVINKNFKEINKYLDDFIKLKSEVFPFIALLAGQYRLMYVVKSLAGTQDSIASKLAIHPYRVRLAKEKSSYYNKEELQKKLLDLCDLDYNLKNTSIDKYILLKVFLVNV